MIRIIFAQPFQPALLVSEILFVISFLGKIPDHIWIRSVTGNQPTEEKPFLLAAVFWPLDLLVIDLDEYMRLHTALIQRGHHPVIMLPIGNIHPALVGLRVVPCPWIKQRRSVIIGTALAFAKIGVISIGIEDDIVETVASNEIERLFHGGHAGLIHVKRPKPVIFVALHEKMRSVFQDKMVRMFLIHAQSSVSVWTRILNADERGGFAIQFLHVGLGHQRPRALSSRRDAHFPRAIAIKESGEREGFSNRILDLGRELNFERVGYFDIGLEDKIVRLPARNGNALGGIGGNTDCRQ